MAKSDFDDVVEIQKIVWRDDDRLDQENLFELQDKIAEFALKIANREHKTEELVNMFPWLYTRE